MIKSKKQMFIIIGLFTLLLFVGGTSYAWFTYRGETGSNEIVAGDIYLTMTEGNETLTLNNVFPESKEEARARNDNYITFTLNGLNESNKTIYYEILLNYGTSQPSPKSRYTDSDLVFDLVELDSNDNEVEYVVDAKSYDSIINKRIWVDTINSNTSTNVSRKYKLRAWLSEDVIISDSEANANYTTVEYPNKYASIKVAVNGDFTVKEMPSGVTMVKAAIEAKQNAATNSCNPIWVDDNGTASDTSDDITYFSGTNDCVDMNYVWYSGKLWRITAIYPDGSMKLVTEDMITSISWGSDTEYDGSWVYQWLNEDFYDTLYNANSIIESNSTWNYSTDENSTPVKPETIETQKTKTAPVGLLNVYEYYNAYRNSSTSANYLNIGYYWWLITPYSSSSVRSVDLNGALSDYSPSLNSAALGVRPSINLKSGLEFTGMGTKTSPYEIVGDKEDAVNNTTLLSSRAVGEYVKFDNDLYRIVDTDNGITKLTRVDYLRDSEGVVTKNLSSSVYYGKSTNTQNDTYWDYYLNNTWYNSISTTYKSMLVDGTYYLGMYQDSKNYKATICKDATLDSVMTNTCSKYTSSDTDKTFTGKVGLPRVGEMFSSQLGSGYSSSSNMWTVTPHATSNVRNVNYNGALGYRSPSSNARGVRPSINLKSGIKIIGGTGYVGGDTNSPFEISE